MNPIYRVRRALISVFDKTGLVPLVEGLKDLKVEIIATGGTARWLKENGIPVCELSDLTGVPELLDGRVKSLHPKIHAGILADRANRTHMKQMRRFGIRPIDLVVVNLYPFEQTVKKRGVSLAEWVEQIDIGGVALARSAAKNFRWVGVVCRPCQYPEVLEALRRHKGSLPESLRRQLACEAFAETSYLDHLIHRTLAHLVSDSKKKPIDWPQRLLMGANLRQVLRYGENPHQRGAWYEWAEPFGLAGGLKEARQLHGKELSFNNLVDLDAAIRVVSAFPRPCAAVIKHSTPCGVACADRIAEALRKAFASDPISAFGGVVGLNRDVDAKTAKAILACGFLEGLVAPRYHHNALKLLKTKKNLRILEYPGMAELHHDGCVELKGILGGLLVQEPDTFRIPPSHWKQATPFRPTPSQMRDLAFAWKVARFARSNAIVVAKNECTLGIGAGQTSRVDSVRLALRKAGRKAKGAVLASDGFFPKPDGPKAAVSAGIRAIVQPGGSIQDPQVIRVAQRARIPMLLTGERHFSH